MLTNEAGSGRPPSLTRREPRDDVGHAPVAHRDAGAVTATKPRPGPGVPSSPQSRHHAGRIEGLDGIRAFAGSRLCSSTTPARWGGCPAGSSASTSSSWSAASSSPRCCSRERERGPHRSAGSGCGAPAGCCPRSSLVVVVSIVVAALVERDLLDGARATDRRRAHFRPTGSRSPPARLLRRTSRPQLFRPSGRSRSRSSSTCSGPARVLLVAFAAAAGRARGRRHAAASAVLMAAPATCRATTRRACTTAPTPTSWLLSAPAWPSPGPAHASPRGSDPRRLGAPGRWAVPIAAAALVACLHVPRRGRPGDLPRRHSARVGLASGVLVLGVLDRPPGRATRRQRLTGAPRRPVDRRAVLRRSTSGTGRSSCSSPATTRRPRAPRAICSPAGGASSSPSPWRT